MTEYKDPNFPAVYKKDDPNLRDFDRFLLQQLEEWQQNLKSILDRGIERNDNVDQRDATFTSNAVADTEDAVTHTLGKIPEGFRVINSDKAATVYDSGTAWTETTIFLKTNVASATITIEVF